MENIQLILSLSGTVIGLFVTTVTFFTKFITNTKGKKAAQRMIAIGNAIIPFVEQAEKFIGYSGAEKKEFVMTKANQFAIQNGIAFKAEQVSEKIEELVELSKQVNKREEKTAA